MNKNRLLMLLLLASWTLNVALGVALVMKTRSPFSGNYSGGRMGPPFGMSPGMPGDIMEERLCKEFPEMEEKFEESKHYRNARKQYMFGLAELFAEDQLDTFKIRSLADSLHQVSGFLHHQHVDHMIEMHCKIPARIRRELIPRMTKKLGDFHDRKHGRKHKRMMRKHFKKNTDKPEDLDFRNYNQ